MNESAVPGGPWRLEELEEVFPWVKWREPQAIVAPGTGRRFACRVCIANNGLRTADVADLPRDSEVQRQHIHDAHVHQIVA